MTAIVSQTSPRTILQDATWPEACPPSHEGFLSVVSGNTHCKFAYHNGSDYKPTCFWRIPVSSHTDTTNTDSTDRFLDSIPHQSAPAQALWKHPDDNTKLTRTGILDYRVTTKRFPVVSIYCISTNPVHEERLVQWFRGLPVRFIRLRPADVLCATNATTTPRMAQLPYPTFGMDRLVAALAAPTFPALVIDGGTALTTTVVDASGTIVGGTISPGFYAQCRALHVGNLPYLSQDELQQFAERTEPLPLFANTTNDAMWNGIVRSVALYVQSVVKTFVQDYELTDKAAAHVIVTGSDGPLLMDLLHPEKCHALLADMPRDFHCDSRLMEHNPHLLHHGMTQILLQHRGVDPLLEWIGLRVARDIGNGCVERVELNDRLDEAAFSIVYDHGQMEVLGAPALYDALIRYSVTRESSLMATLHSSAVEQKRNDSEQAAAQLAERCPTVAEHKEERAQSPLVYKPQRTKATQSTVDGPPARKRGRPRTIKPRTPKKIDRRKKQHRNTLPEGVAPTDYISRRVAKFFEVEETPYFGTVISYDPEEEFWKIRYDDDDMEDMEYHELAVQLQCFEENNVV